ncbi:MAG: energy-coupling factor transporter transmembrane protein EcfT [Clostridiales bacterium]|nr:energy-coupling factor transporter transmembrane protein EcfT [Clostridiales bacterium]
MHNQQGLLQGINPSCKLIGLIVLSFALAFCHHPVLNLGIFAVSVLFILLSDANKRAFFIPMIPVLILAVGLFFTGYRFTHAASDVVNMDVLHVGSSQIWNGLIFASRALVYAGIGLLFALTTDRIRMIRSFNRQLHVPQVFAYGLLAAWGLLPQMMLEYRRTRMAFRARGIRVLPFSPLLLVTLLVKSTRWSEELSIAMESKGFSANAPRSTFEPERVRARDWVFLAVTCIVLPALAVFFFR